MKVTKTKFKNLVLIKTKIHHDNRGFFKENFKYNTLKKKFVFDCVSMSKKNVLRGLHLQTKNPQGKLISVLTGEIFDVALDLRKNSKTFGKYFSIKINEKSDFSIYIPPHFAHGFLCLSKECKILYKCTNYRSQKHEKTILWNDSDLNIKWPKANYVVSQKDLKGSKYHDFITKNL